MPDPGAEDPSAPRFLAVGRVLGPFGVHGEVKVQILTEFPDRFARLQTAYLNEVPYEVEASRLHGKVVLLKLEGVDSPEAAALLRDQLVEVPREEAVELPPDHYYDYQILGLQVVTIGGEEVGEVINIIHSPANDVYVVATGRGEALIPAVQVVVKEIDLEHRRIRIEPMPGLLP